MIDKKYFQLSGFNNRVKFFVFLERNLGNPIPPIKVEHLQKKYMTLSVSEMFASFSYFGVLIGDLVAEDDETWEFYLNFHETVTIFFSRTIFLSTLELFKTLIENLHKDYCVLFNGSLVAKHHIYTTALLFYK